MVERQYWNEDNGLGIAVDGDVAAILINSDAELYGIPNPDRCVMMERGVSLSEDKSIASLVRKLETTKVEPYRSQMIREISEIVWPRWYDPID